MSMSVLPMCIYMCTMYMPGTSRDQKMVLDSLGLGLGVVQPVSLQKQQKLLISELTQSKFFRWSLTV